MPDRTLEAYKHNEALAIKHNEALLQSLPSYTELQDRVAFLENQDVECFEAIYTLQERIAALEKLVFRLINESKEAAEAELNSYPLNHIDKLKARVGYHSYL